MFFSVWRIHFSSLRGIIDVGTLFSYNSWEMGGPEKAIERAQLLLCVLSPQCPTNILVPGGSAFGVIGSACVSDMI